jgi:thymidylate synthase ThyX
MTHRVFSRNAASSRAIPISKVLEAVKQNPAEPEFWGENQKGMQAAVELDNTERTHREYLGEPLLTKRELARTIWLQARDVAVAQVERLNKQDVHKQIANRVVEPWSHITVLATATDYTNFFALRAHKDAQPEFQVLAYTMLLEYVKSTPKKLGWDEWHIPFNDKMPEGTKFEDKLKIATARAARISYNTFDGEINAAKDIELHDRLAASGHWSPFEHCAYASKEERHTGNFNGWVQYRKSFSNENPTEVNYATLLANMPEWVYEAIKRNKV